MPSPDVQEMVQESTALSDDTLSATATCLH